MRTVPGAPVAAEKLPARYLPVAFLGFAGAWLTRQFLLPPERLGAWLGLHRTVASLIPYAFWSLLAAWLLVQGLGASRAGWRGALTAGAAGAGAGAALAGILLWLPVDGALRALGIPWYWEPARARFVEPSSAADFLALALLGVLLVPLAEETLFRGFLLPLLQERLGTGGGLLLHNLIFALIHVTYGPGTMIFIFFWSFLPGILYTKYRSVYPSLIMHGLNNVFVDLLVPVLFG